MKKISKRFIALLIALVMCASYSAVAFADNTAENNSHQERVITKEVVSEIARAGSIQYLPETVSRSEDEGYFVQRIGYGIQVGDTNTIQFAMPRDAQLVTRFIVSGKCHIKVELGGHLGIFWSTLLEEDVENSQLWQISNSTLYSGMQVKVTITGLSYSSSTYSLYMWGE